MLVSKHCISARIRLFDQLKNQLSYQKFCLGSNQKVIWTWSIHRTCLTNNRKVLSAMLARLGKKTCKRTSGKNDSEASVSVQAYQRHEWQRSFSVRPDRAQKKRRYNDIRKAWKEDKDRLKSSIYSSLQFQNETGCNHQMSTGGIWSLYASRPWDQKVTKCGHCTPIVHRRMFVCLFVCGIPLGLILGHPALSPQGGRRGKITLPYQQTGWPGRATTKRARSQLEQRRLKTRID